MPLLETLSDWLQTHAKSFQTLVVAYSGGRDSHVLLQALHDLQNRSFSLRAIHINHGLMAKAEQWVTHCQQTCQDLNIPLTVIPLALQPGKGESVEALARTQRYLAFSQHLQEKELLLTAHSMEDQAETFLLQLLRGTGPLGLGGIAAFKPLGNSYVGRPLLGIERAQIATFAEVKSLTWIEDESNQNLRFRRNFLRHTVFPQLQQDYPGVTACIARSAFHCAQSQKLLQEYLEEELKPCLGEKPHILNLTCLKKLSPLKQSYVLRHWLQLNRIPFPSTKKLTELLQQIFYAKEDAQPEMRWPGAYLRRYKDALYSLPPPANLTPLTHYRWDLSKPLCLPDGSIWHAKRIHGQGLAVAKIGQPYLDVSFRQGGERCRPAGSGHSRSLKKILQERQVPAWQRAYLPLLYHHHTLVGVAHLFTCEGWQNEDEQAEGWLIEPCMST